MSTSLSESQRGVVPEDSLVGRVIDGKYDVKELIGKGGMGTVYRVRDWDWNVDLAVKVPLRHLVADWHNRERFILEAQTWIDLGVHPNIVQCWFVREYEGLPLVFMDYLPMGSLKDYRKAGHVQPGEWEKILDLMIQACTGIGYAHDQGLVHRDVKPANFLLREGNRLCVTDFGLVKVTEFDVPADLHDKVRPNFDDFAEIEEELSSLTLTGTGTLLGTPEYGAPEQWIEARGAGPQADVYALGVILFELAAGRRPFDDGVNRVAGSLLMGRHLSKPAPDPRDFNPDIPAPIAELAVQCLSKRPEDRPASMVAMREALEKIHRDVMGKSYPRPLPRAGAQRADALNNKAVSLWHLGFSQKAFDAWREASKLDALHPETVYNRSLLQLRQGQIDEAEVLRRLMQVKSAYPHLGAYLGYFHLDRCAHEEAAKELKEALQYPLAARNGAVWRALGDAYMYLEQFPVASEAYERALERMPEDREARSRLGMAKEHVRHMGERIRFPLSQARRVQERKGPITAVTITPDLQNVLHANEDGLEMWDMHTGLRIWNDSSSGPIARLLAVGEWTISLDSPHGRVWSTKSGQVLYELEGRKRFLAMIPGQVAALAGGETLDWVELPHGRVVKSFAGHTKSVSCAYVPPDGRLAISGSGDRTVRLWDLESGECLKVLEGHTDLVESVAMTPDRTVALSGGRDKTVRVWQVATGDCLFVLEHADEVRRLRLSSDGRYLVVSSWSVGSRDQIDVWEVATGERLFTRPGGYCMQFLQGGPWVLVGSRMARPGMLHLWEIPSGRLLRTLIGHNSEIQALALSRDDRWAVTGSTFGNLRVWELDWASRVGELSLVVNRTYDHTEVESTQQKFFEALHRAQDLFQLNEWGLAYRYLSEARSVPGYIRDPVALSLNASLLKKLARKSVRAVWQLRSCTSSGPLSAIAITPDGAYAMSATGKGLFLWELSSGSCLRGFTGHSDTIRSVAVTPDGQTAASGGLDGSVRIWNLRSGDCVKILRSTEGIVGLRISDDGKFLLAMSTTTLFAWNVTRGELLWTKEASRLSCMDMTSDGRLAVIGADPVRMFHLPEGQEPLAFFRLPKGRDDWKVQGPMTHLALSGDGNYALSANADLYLRIWDLEKGACEACWWGHPQPFTGIALSSDARIALSASQDGSLKIWDVVAGQALETIGGPPGSIVGLAMTPDARFVLTAGSDQNLRLWELDWELSPETTASSLSEAWKRSGLLSRLSQLLWRRK